MQPKILSYFKLTHYLIWINNNIILYFNLSIYNNNKWKKKISIFEKQRDHIH